MLKILVLLLSVSSNFILAQDTFYICGDCHPPLGQDEYTGFFSGYYEMTRNKRKVIGVGSSQAPVLTPQYKSNDPYTKLMQEKLEAGEIPFAEKDGNSYEILNTLYAFEKNPKEGGKLHLKKSNMREKFVNYLKQLDKSGPIVINISGHGWNGGSAGDGSLPPAKSGFAIRGAVLGDRPQDVIVTHEEFVEILKEAGLTGDNAPPVRIVAEHCYGGGIHYVSEKLPNVCTASFTSNEMEHRTAEQLPEKFWQNYNAMKENSGKAPSLNQTFNSIKPDLGRNKGASLGSTQFVKNILAKKGINMNTNDEGISHWRQMLVKTDIDHKTCESLDPNSLSVPNNLRTLINDTDAIFNSPSEPMLAFMKKNGADLSTYQNALNELEAKESYYKKAINDYFSQNQKAKKEWEELSEKEKKIKSQEYTDSIYSFGNWLIGDFEESKKEELAKLSQERTTALDNYDQMKKKYLPAIQEYFQNLDTVNQLNETQEFFRLYKNGQISKEDFSTYQRMLACESIPL